jgi:hypothetical protein
MCDQVEKENMTDDEKPKGKTARRGPAKRKSKFTVRKRGAALTRGKSRVSASTMNALDFFHKQTLLSQQDSEYLLPFL